MRHCGAMRVGGAPARRVRFWLALRGSPPGRRALPVIEFCPKNDAAKTAIYHVWQGLTYNLRDFCHGQDSFSRPTTSPVKIILPEVPFPVGRWAEGPIQW